MTSFAKGRSVPDTSAPLQILQGTFGFASTEDNARQKCYRTDELEPNRSIDQHEYHYSNKSSAMQCRTYSLAGIADTSIHIAPQI